jgi:hypothetical protein
MWWASGGPKRLDAAKLRRNPERELQHAVERLRAKVAAMSDRAFKRYDEDLCARNADWRVIERWLAFRGRGK